MQHYAVLRKYLIGPRLRADLDPPYKNAKKERLSNQFFLDSLPE